MRSQVLRGTAPALLALLWGCFADGRSSSSATTLPEGPPGPEGPLKLLVGVHEPYCRKTACKCVDFIARREFEPLQRKMKERFGIDLDLRYYPGDHFKLLRDVREGALDGALSKPWPVLWAARGAGRNYLRLADLPGPEGRTDLRGLVVVPKDSPVRSWEDLVGKRLALGQEDAYEKHHAVRVLLRRHGVDPGRLQLLEFSGCMENIGAVLDGKAEAAAVSDYSFEADCLVEVARREDYRILGETEPPIPAVSFLLDLDRISPPTANRVRRALLELRGDPELKEPLLGEGFVPARPWSPPELAPLRR